MVIEATVPASTAEAIKLGLSNEGLQVPIDLSAPFWGGNTLFIKCRVQVKKPRPTNKNHRIISVFISLVGESDEEDDEEREANRESEELEGDVGMASRTGMTECSFLVWVT